MSAMNLTANFLQILGCMRHSLTMVQLFSVVPSVLKGELRAKPCWVGSGPIIPNCGKHTGTPPLQNPARRAVRLNPDTIIPFF